MCHVQRGFAVVFPHAWDKAPSGHGKRVSAFNPHGSKPESDDAADMKSIGRPVLALGILMGVFDQAAVDALKPGETLRCRQECRDWCAAGYWHAIVDVVLDYNMTCGVQEHDQTM